MMQFGLEKQNSVREREEGVLIEALKAKPKEKETDRQTYKYRESEIDI